MELAKLLNAMPGAVSQGLIWGLMAIGVYITYKILDVADLTVDGSIATGGAVAAGALQVLLVTFKGRLMVSHGVPPLSLKCFRLAGQAMMACYCRPMANWCC